MTPATPPVFLVGAGPGDPGLLTRRGAEVLAAAEVVVYDRLAAPALLELAPPEAERISVGKAPGRAEASQDEINALLVTHAQAGRRVVRLKGGDPFVFGRGGEEAEALRAAGVAFEVVPGVTSALAAPAYAGIPVTHRGLARAVTIVTGHEDPTQEVAGVDWAALARAGGTLVILMGASRIDAIAAALRAGGLPGDTPVAAVQRGTRPDQATLRATLATIGDAAPAAPAAIVVGPVAALDLAWFEQRPLFGRTVVVTRAREQASGLRATLETLGAAVAELPAIVVEPLAVTLPDLSRFAWLVLTSANGVEALFAALRAAGRDARALAGVRVAVIGPGTAAALDAHGVHADLLPERFVAEALLEAFPAPSRPGEAVLVARAAQARDVLPDGLGARGYTVEVLPLYATRPAPPDDEVVAALHAGRVDAVTFTSSSTVTNFCDAVGPLEHPPLVVSIGPVTSATARERGLHVDAEASEHTIDGLVARLVETLTQ
ncbi:MAG TPA: uroporphyrinogen-III C-methyltransferase [Acidimicrobiia bacterium]|nr:uroporphyrinogen-III C-methyltransferase [Acidimicrobiia bacterium]